MAQPTQSKSKHQGQHFALEALTAPNPTPRQWAIIECARRLRKRNPNEPRATELKAAYLVTVMIRWGYLTSNEVPSLTQMAYLKLIGSIVDAWNILIANGE